MKVKFIKNNKDGFALLFSVLVSSLLLTIGLSIFSIALKELAISTAARQSVFAFFAADSGRECAIYWDIKRNKIPTLILNQTGGKIECGQSGELDLTDNDIDLDGPVSAALPPAGKIMLTDADEYNFSVEITKTWLDPGTHDRIITTVTSRGYDSTSDNRVERAIQQTY